MKYHIDVVPTNPEKEQCSFVFRDKDYRDDVFKKIPEYFKTTKDKENYIQVSVYNENESGHSAQVCQVWNFDDELYKEIYGFLDQKIDEQ